MLYTINSGFRQTIGNHFVFVFVIFPQAIHHLYPAFAMADLKSKGMHRIGVLLDLNCPYAIDMTKTEMSSAPELCFSIVIDSSDTT